MGRRKRYTVKKVSYENFVLDRTKRTNEYERVIWIFKNKTKNYPSLSSPSFHKYLLTSVLSSHLLCSRLLSTQDDVCSSSVSKYGFS